MLHGRWGAERKECYNVPTRHQELASGPNKHPVIVFDLTGLTDTRLGALTLVLGGRSGTDDSRHARHTTECGHVEWPSTLHHASLSLSLSCEPSISVECAEGRAHERSQRVAAAAGAAIRNGHSHVADDTQLSGNARSPRRSEQPERWSGSASKRRSPSWSREEDFAFFAGLFKIGVSRLTRPESAAAAIGTPLRAGRGASVTCELYIFTQSSSSESESSRNGCSLSVCKLGRRGSARPLRKTIDGGEQTTVPVNSVGDVVFSWPPVASWTAPLFASSPMSARSSMRNEAAPLCTWRGCNFLAGYKQAGKPWRRENPLSFLCAG